MLLQNETPEENKDADCRHKKRKGIMAPLPIQRGSKYYGKKQRAKVGDIEICEVENWNEDTYGMNIRGLPFPIVEKYKLVK